MTPECSIDTVKEKHARLYEEVLKAGLDATPDSAFRREADELVEQLKRCALEVKTVEDYRWLSQTAMQWQVVYSSKWNIAKTVEIPLPLEAPILQPLPADKALTETELGSWQRGHADYLGVRRLIDQKRESTQAEKDWDWHQAEVLICTDILDGFPNFASRISRESYPRLERVWLTEVKQLRAYFIWEKDKTYFDPVREAEHYREASKHLQDMLVNDQIKAQTVEFAAVKAYLEDRYLTAGKVVHEGGDEKTKRAKALIDIKALHIKETRKDVGVGSGDDLTNWVAAETYVRSFYENIIPAVEKKDSILVLKALKAFQYSIVPENRWRVINCFEAALAIYFLDRAIIEQLWKDSQDLPVPASHLVSSVTVSWRLPESDVPDNCMGSFASDGKQITFRGVMADEQRDALMKKLKDPSYLQDVELLCRRTRFLSRDTTL